MTTKTPYSTDLEPISMSEMLSPVKVVPESTAESRDQGPQPPQPATESKALEPEKAPDVLEKALPDDLVTRLSERFKIAKERLVDVSVKAGGQTVVVSVRRSHYDDYMWAVGVVEERIKSDSGIAASETRRLQYMEHITICRTVVKIEGEYVWDVFRHTEDIKAEAPDWDGVSYTGIPQKYLGVMAEQVYDLFRNLHYDFLFGLSRLAEEAFDEAADPNEAT